MSEGQGKLRRAKRGGGLLSRRRVLGAGLASVALAVEGSTGRALAAPLASGDAGSPDLAIPELPSTRTVATGAVQSFRSRPDLAPPAVRVSMDRPGQASGLIFMDSHRGPGDQGPIIVDSSGDLVWFQKVSVGPASPARAFNVRVQWWNGKPVLTWFDGSVVAAHGQGDYVIMSPSYKQLKRVRAGNGYSDDLHAFLLTPRGTALVSCYGMSYANLSAYGGPAWAPYFYGVAQEVDLATGRVVFQWRSDEHVGFDESYAPVTHSASQPWDYFHINSITLARDGDLIISARNTWGVYKVGRTSGVVRWRMGGKKSDFEIGPGARFYWQHDVTEQADGSFTVFDNGAGDYDSEPQSRGLVLGVDDEARRVTLRRQYLHPQGALLAGALGSVQYLEEGHVFVGWGARGAFTEYAADGSPLLNGYLGGQGTESYRAFRNDWVGSPPGPPALAVERTGNTMTLYASWNGATQVTRWLVLGGRTPSALGALGAAFKKGFETIIEVPQRTAYVAVAGLDGSGHELGRSKVLAV